MTIIFGVFLLTFLLITAVAIVRTGLANLADNLTGPTARALILIAIVVSGVAWAFTEHGTGGRRLSQIVFGAAIALGAVALLTALGITGATI